MLKSSMGPISFITVVQLKQDDLYALKFFIPANGHIYYIRAFTLTTASFGLFLSFLYCLVRSKASNNEWDK